MKGFLGKIFGGKKGSSYNDETSALVADVLQKLLEMAKIELSFDLQKDSETGDITIDLFGDDEELLFAREAQLLDAFQLYIKRVVQHQMPDEKVNIHVDSAGYRQQANDSLIELAEKLKTIAVERGKPVYFRALPPRDRKVIHQYLAEDGRVKSRSIGEGLYKKIKIYPVKGEDEQRGNVAPEPTI